MLYSVNGVTQINNNNNENKKKKVYRMCTVFAHTHLSIPVHWQNGTMAENTIAVKLNSFVVVCEQKYPHIHPFRRGFLFFCMQLFVLSCIIYGRSLLCTLYAVNCNLWLWLKEKKVISKTNIKRHTHTGTHMDTGKMRNKIDMFNVKCRKNHTIRLLTSIMFCGFWWWCDACVSDVYVCLMLQGIVSKVVFYPIEIVWS